MISLPVIQNAFKYVPVAITTAFASYSIYYYPYDNDEIGSVDHLKISMELKNFSDYQIYEIYILLEIVKIQFH